MLTLLVVLPFIGALIAACMPSGSRNRPAAVAGAVTAIALGLAISAFGQVSSGAILRERYTWLPDAGLNLAMRMDGLAWVFTVMVLGIGLLVLLYARYYMSQRDPVARFFAYMLAFMGSMLGVVLSGNLIQLVVFWELTSVTSFLLIGYWQHRNDARRGARMAFTVTTIGGLCLLAGVLILGHIVGSYDLDAVLAAGDKVRAHAWYVPVLVLIALGALTKSAQFPFHFWLPHAMAAPTPVSAFLHSATMVKAGVFLLIRLWPVLSGTEEWTWILGTAGVCTLLIGSFFAIFQNDMKGLLAYSTISHLGLIVVLLSIGSPLSVVAAIFHTINHAIFKASLFMAVGIIDHETGTRDMRLLSVACDTPCPTRPRWPSSPARRWRACRCSMASCPKKCFLARRCRSAAPNTGRCRTRPWPWACSAWPIRCVSSACSSVRLRRICQSSRTSRRAGCAFRSNAWWCCALLSA